MVFYHRGNGEWGREGQCFLKFETIFLHQLCKSKHKHEVLWTCYPHRPAQCNNMYITVWHLCGLTVNTASCDWKKRGEFFSKLNFPPKFYLHVAKSHVFTFQPTHCSSTLFVQTWYKCAHWWTTSAWEVTSGPVATIGHTKIMSLVFFLGLCWKCKYIHFQKC